MKPIERALEYIENNLEEEISIKQLSNASFISPFHLSRVFKTITGYTIQEYIRLRRLTKAVALLSLPQTSILEVAIAVGYKSNSAFTKAFSKQFSKSPKAYKANPINLESFCVQALKLSKKFNIAISEPRIEGELNLTIVGLQTNQEGASTVWEYIHPHLPFIKNRVGIHQHGCSVVENVSNEDEFDLFYGFPVSKIENVHEALEVRTFENETCAVFHNKGKLKTFIAFVIAVYAEWFPDSAYEPINSQQFQFINPSTEKDLGYGEEGIYEWDLWIPVKMR